MTTAIASWGNSEAVRIPRDILKRAGLRKGDRVSFRLNDEGHLEIMPETDTHRRVEPARGVNFDSLFKGYTNDGYPSVLTWPNDDFVGAERDAWFR